MMTNEDLAAGRDKGLRMALLQVADALPPDKALKLYRGRHKPRPSLSRFAARQRRDERGRHDSAQVAEDLPQLNATVDGMLKVLVEHSGADDAGPILCTAGLPRIQMVKGFARAVATRTHAGGGGGSCRAIRAGICGVLGGARSARADLSRAESGGFRNGPAVWLGGLR